MPLIDTGIDLIFYLILSIFFFFTSEKLNQRSMQICRAARSLGCRNIEQEVADDPMKEG